MKRKIIKYVCVSMDTALISTSIPLQETLGADLEDSVHIVGLEKEASPNNTGNMENILDGTDKVSEAIADPTPENSRINEELNSEDITEIFTDTAFRSAIRQKLGLNDDDPLTRSACSNIQELDLSGRGITTLAGIEYFTALRKLNCNDN
jgi:hypothetical protein